MNNTPEKLAAPNDGSKINTRFKIYVVSHNDTMNDGACFGSADTTVTRLQVEKNVALVQVGQDGLDSMEKSIIAKTFWGLEISINTEFSMCRLHRLFSSTGKMLRKFSFY